MSKVIVSGFSLSVDGYGAGPDQRLEDPLGKRGEELHTWMVGTAMFHRMTGKDGGSEGVDMRRCAWRGRSLAAEVAAQECQRSTQPNKKEQHHGQDRHWNGNVA